jgi:prepilin-type N-terminal cleavage/methylation domain-containing protein/prepilin-type processing-associated H-X9-DG protein
VRISNTRVVAAARSHSTEHKPGFSLVELLVVMAIIGTLISLLLPALSSSRAAARRTECQNHLKQLSLAILNYETAEKKLPPAGLCGDRTKDIFEGPFYPRGGQMISWVVLVMPYFEEQNLFRQFDLHQSVLQQAGDPQATPLPILMCPSDETQGRYFSDSALTAGKRFAKANYAAFVSPYHVSFADWWPSGLSGVHPYRLSSVLDGATNTLLLSEVRTRANEQDQRGAWALPWTGSTLLAFDEHDAAWPAPEDDALKDSYMASEFSYSVSSISAGQTQPPNNLGPNFDILYDCSDAAGAQKDSMPCATFGSSFDWLSAAPRSKHIGGVNVAFLDGHIGFLPDTIDEKTMAYLVSATDGQTADLSSVR